MILASDASTWAGPRVSESLRPRGESRWCSRTSTDRRREGAGWRLRLLTVAATRYHQARRKRVCVSESISAERQLAHWLLVTEMTNSVAPEGLPEAAERVCQKLGMRLARLITLAGFSVLVGRALHLARSEYSFLTAVRAGSPPGQWLEGLSERIQGVESEQARAALTAIVGDIFGLLNTFIGEDLAWRLVRDVWPDAPLGGTGSQLEVDH